MLSVTGTQIKYDMVGGSKCDMVGESKCDMVGESKCDMAIERVNAIWP